MSKEVIKPVYMHHNPTLRCRVSVSKSKLRLELTLQKKVRFWGWENLCRVHIEFEEGLDKRNYPSVRVFHDGYGGNIVLLS